ncbi:MAG TPA: metalloregulator ArsR/SmtB family transcription factor [Mycobacteriales bacterium]|nr:metalloregulator ArsR/SmtB family transcription factor [Mycobacteriales bacterium]
MTFQPRAGSRPGGDVDLAAVGALVADPGRCRILLALGDGRALPASRLADEAGVSAATASSHLGKLTEAGLLTVEARGRHRYHRLAGPEVADLIEALQRLAPAAPVRSLRQGTRAAALREARTCYDHVAGKLGVALMAALIDKGHLVGGDGSYDPALSDARAGFGHEVDYRLSPSGAGFLAELGVRIPPHRRLMRYCVDWSEQRHHLAGGLGRGLLDRLLELDWVRRTEASRALRVPDGGRDGLRATFGIDLT